jgi:hypothetical protein
MEGLFWGGVPVFKRKGGKPEKAPFGNGAEKNGEKSGCGDLLLSMR